MHGLEVRKVRGMGRGVFATKNYKVGDTIEVCPVILFPHKEGSKKPAPGVGYCWRWDKDRVGIALGYGSLYNHKVGSNAEMSHQARALTSTVTAVKPIKKGEQVFVNYMGDCDCTDEVWF